MKPGIDKPVILFDGVCNLCQGSVQFVLKHDRKKQFFFASLQSSVATELLNLYGTKLPRPDSILLLEHPAMFTKSTAALRICRRLTGGYRLLYGLIIIPAPIRDFFYDMVAKHRYKWFGRLEECWLPTPELQARFLD